VSRASAMQTCAQNYQPQINYRNYLNIIIHISTSSVV